MRDIPGTSELLDRYENALKLCAEWKARAEANERDAERYRWLRDKHPSCNLWIKGNEDETLRIIGTPLMNEAIDAAIAKESQS